VCAFLISLVLHSLPILSCRFNRSDSVKVKSDVEIITVCFAIVQLWERIHLYFVEDSVNTNRNQIKRVVMGYTEESNL
jgi:hypothetical protein